MNPRTRIEKLLTRARATARTKRRAGRMTACRDAPWAEVIERVMAAMPPGAGAVVEAIGRHVAACRASPPRERANGAVVQDRHYFTDWLVGLQAGAWALPPQIPLAVLEAFGEPYGCILRRCEDCRMALPQ